MAIYNIPSFATGCPTLAILSRIAPETQDQSPKNLQRSKIPNLPHLPPVPHPEVKGDTKASS